MSSRTRNCFPSGRHRSSQTEIGADKEAAGAVPKKAPDHGVGQTGAAVVGRQLAAPEHAMDAEAGDPDGTFTILEYVARPLDRQPLGCADDAPAGVVVRGDAAVSWHPQIAAAVDGEIAAGARRR